MSDYRMTRASSIGAAMAMGEHDAFKQGRLSALREVRKVVDGRLGSSYNDAIRGHYKYFMRKFDALIAKEEGK